MDQIAHLLSLADAYRVADPIEEKTLSFRVFGDSKKLMAMRHGADITVGRASAALTWFSRNWPADAPWPADIHRPAIPQQDRAAS